MSSSLLVRKLAQKTKRSQVSNSRRLGAIVRALRQVLPALTQNYGVLSIGIFGSYLNGSTKETSDLDLLVEYRADTPYQTRFALYKVLQERLAVPLDLIENKNLKPYIARRVRPQVVWLLRNGVPQAFKRSTQKRDGHQAQKNGGDMGGKMEYLDYIQDMLNGMSRATRYIQGTSLEQLPENEEKLYAVSYATQRIGEAANRIPEEIQKLYPKIPWREIIGMRHWIAHGYDRIDSNVFWKTLTESIPQDEPLVRQMLEAELKRRKLDE